MNTLTFSIYTQSEKNVPDAIPSSKNEDVEEHIVERNGFRIPQGRTIIETKKANELYTPVKSIDAGIPFSLKNSQLSKLNRLKILQTIGCKRCAFGR